MGQNRTTLGVIEMLQTGTHFKPRVERRHLNLAPCDVAERVRLSGDDDDVHERGAHTRATVQHACTHARRGAPRDSTGVATPEHAPRASARPPCNVPAEQAAFKAAVSPVVNQPS